MSPLEILAATLISLVAVAVISFVVETLRPSPIPPERLSWAPEIPIRYAEVEGVKLRYIKAGTGPNIVLLHTLRTQLDLFEKVIPTLAKKFTVYALDYPAHGYSDIPSEDYDASFFVRLVEGFLDALDLGVVTLCGVSIGGSISLIVAGQQNKRVERVIAINPYDYFRGRGMTRSSFLGWLITVASETPVIAGTIMRLRNFIIMKAVFRGGVANPESLGPELLKEMYLVGNRRGHYRAFISLLRHAGSWEASTEFYGRIHVPTLLLWGDQDWSRIDERENDRKVIPNVSVTTINNGGHFLPLDRPTEVVQEIVGFAAGGQANYNTRT